MKLYINPFSSASRRAEMTARTLNSKVEFVLIDLNKNEQRSPEFLALNPNGAVPVLVDGDLVLPESHAIMAYLCDHAGEEGAKLYPTDLKARAVVNRWLHWSSNHWGPANAGLNFENNLKKLFGQGEADPAQVARHEIFFKKYAGILNEHLGEHDFVAGDALSIADISIAAPLMYLRAAKLPLEEFSHLRMWFSRMRELPAWHETEPKR